MLGSDQPNVLIQKETEPLKQRTGYGMRQGCMSPFQSPQGCCTQATMARRPRSHEMPPRRGALGTQKYSVRRTPHDIQPVVCDSAAHRVHHPKESSTESAAMALEEVRKVGSRSALI